MKPPGDVPPILHRLIAGIGITLVLGLIILAASPAAHAWLHGGDSPHEGRAPADWTQEHDCVVTLFGAGIDASAGHVAVVPLNVVDGGRRAVPREFHLASPRYLHQPERGPPLVRAL